jgi:hypothetical protein
MGRSYNTHGEEAGIKKIISKNLYGRDHLHDLEICERII